MVDDERHGDLQLFFQFFVDLPEGSKDKISRFRTGIAVSRLTIQKPPLPAMLHSPSG